MIDRSQQTHGSALSRDGGDSARRPQDVCHTPRPRAVGTPLVSRSARCAFLHPFSPWDSCRRKCAWCGGLPNYARGTDVAHPFEPRVEKVKLSEFVRISSTKKFGILCAEEGTAMATATSDEIKTELMSRGIWPNFVRLRAEEKAKNGGTSRTQTIAALEHIAPDLVPLVRPRGRPPKGTPPSPPSPQGSALPENAVADFAPEFSVGATKPEPTSKPTLAETKFARKEARMGGAQEAARVSRRMFSNKSCSNMTSLIWAVESLAFSDTTADDAPSALAWSLYSLMVSSPASKAEIVKVTAAKIAQRASVEEENGGKFDGEGEYDVLAKLRGGE